MTIDGAYRFAAIEMIALVNAFFIYFYRRLSTDILEIFPQHVAVDPIDAFMPIS